MADDARLERWLDRMLARATTPRGAGVVIASATTAITLGAGILMTVIDGDNFPSIRSGLWWAVQTVTTVGYGDNVPTNVSGQLLAALVMLLGIGFLTVITAAITSTFCVALTPNPVRYRHADSGAVAADERAARTNRSRARLADCCSTRLRQLPGIGPESAHVG